MENATLVDKKPDINTLGAYTLGPSGTNAGIYTGDARRLAEQLPDGSVDLIICDPVYWQTEDYAWLAETAVRVLVEGGSLIAQTGIEFRFQAEQAMFADGLYRRPLLIETYSGGFMQMWKHRMLNGYHGYLWATKGEKVARDTWVRNLVSGAGKDKSRHDWGDTPRAMSMWIAALTPLEGVVLDPFTGSGTVPCACKQLRRRWLAFEIDAQAAESARASVLETQPPLFVDDISQQLDMFEEGGVL